MKNYVFGDTGGHAVQLLSSLEAIGVDLENFIIPDDVRIIHLGDLIHKGPMSKELVEIVNMLIVNNPNRWVQILGNHEFQHIEGSPYFWKCDCSFKEVDVINEWFETGKAAASFGLDTHKIESLEVSAKPKLVLPETGILFTHAGLTNQWWNALERPVSPVEASRLINMLPSDIVTTAGEMLGVRGYAGPVWAVGNTEVFNSWVSSEADMPFLQFHGHTTSYVWRMGKWWRNDAGFKEFRQATKLNPESRAVITSVANNFMIGIDPGYAKTADTKMQPFVAFES